MGNPQAVTLHVKPEKQGLLNILNYKIWLKYYVIEVTAKGKLFLLTSATKSGYRTLRIIVT